MGPPRKYYTIVLKLVGADVSTGREYRAGSIRGTAMSELLFSTQGRNSNRRTKTVPRCSWYRKSFPNVLISRIVVARLLVCEIRRNSNIVGSKNRGTNFLDKG
jgi:hypothetical protein